jgi:uncharacterized protein YndB with AHSA1/START domain
VNSITLAIEVDAAPSKVFDVLSTTEGQRAFWTYDCDVAADHARFGFDEAPIDLEVDVHLEPDTLVRMTVTSGFPFWDASTWEWELAANDHDKVCTTVVFRHYGFVEGYPESALGGTAQTWAMTLDHLAKFIKSGEPSPYFVKAKS